MKLLSGLLWSGLMPGILVAQFSFEGFPTVRYEQTADWVPILKETDGEFIGRTATLPGFFDSDDNLRIELIVGTPSGIRLHQSSTLTTFVEPAPYFGSMVDSIGVADIDGDGRRDLKFAWSAGGSGLAGYGAWVVYLFQTEPGVFTKVSYYTFYMGSASVERDFDADARYEIVTCGVTSFENHNYWTFNVYNFAQDRLVNVNDHFDFPMMVQLLNRENYEPTERIGREQRKKLSAAQPTDLDIQRGSPLAQTQDFGWAAQGSGFFPIGWNRDGTLFAYGSFSFGMHSSSLIHVALQDIASDNVVWDFGKNWEESLVGDSVIVVPGTAGEAWKEIQALVEEPLSSYQIEPGGRYDPSRFPIQDGHNLNVEIIEEPEVDFAVPYLVRAVSQNLGVKAIFRSVKHAGNKLSVLGYFPSPDWSWIAVVLSLEDPYPPYLTEYHVIGCHLEYGFEKVK